ncbi:MAG TPA: GNAT family N-acetyltransferase [Candidatus Saccharimonadales bacterium]|nr:GNAT family N-acetyltransferase [Candidatus Saccharimonadales bacterium]
MPVKEELRPPYTQIRVDEHLVLRQLQPEEAQELFDLTKKNWEYLKPWMPWLEDNRTVKDSEKFIRSALDKKNQEILYGYGMIYDGRIAGHMSIMHLKDEMYPEIGYWLDNELNGRGLTTKAVKRLTDFGLNTLGLKQILIKALPENGASNRVAEKCGYVLKETKEYPGRGPMNVWVVRG